MGEILGFLLIGLLAGALGRLAIPGPNPMSWIKTILVGIGGAFLGGIVGVILGFEEPSFLLAIAGAALIVWLLQRR